MEENISFLCLKCVFVGCRMFNENIYGLLETDKQWAVSFILNHPSQVYLHSVTETSNYDLRPQFLWVHGMTVDLLITMKQTYTTDDATQLTIGQRKCIFPDEVKLSYYKNDMYSLSACMKQCRMNKANRFCKCIPPFYEPATGSYRQCTLKDFACLNKYRQNITNIRGCSQCELSCLNTIYESEMYLTRFDNLSHFSFVVYDNST
jgi:acid-sensing ion channel, other